VFLAKNGAPGEKIAIADAKIGQEILIRKGEVIPLDGILVSATALTDESSLTGEPYMIDKLQGDELRSGTINAGNPIVLKVTKVDADSTYRKIIEMVKQAQVDKPKFLRMADKYSTVFTLITFTIVLLTYFATGSIERVLAVLVIATPCPLILAAPVALFGGMNAAAKRRVLLKKLSSIEVLSRVTDIIFDKTGTITLGVPKVSSVEVIEKKMELPFVYSVAEAIERHSLHPLAKAIVGQARITGDNNSFIFSVNDEFSQVSKKSPIDKKNPKITEAESELLTALLEQKKYCLDKSGEAHFIITSRQEKIFDMTFAHLIEQNYKARPIAPRMYFGQCEAR
jgi:P-type E1-E2 ATPase